MRPKFLSSAVLLASLALAVPAHAAENAAPTPAPAPAIVVRGGAHADFERLVFDWPHAPAYSMHRDGNLVTVKFAAAGKANFRQALIAHLTHAGDFSTTTDKDGNLVATFTVAANTILQSFTSGNSVVIDIRNVSAAAPVASTVKKSEPKPQATIAKAAAPAVATQKVQVAATPAKTAPTPTEKPAVPATAIVATTPAPAGPTPADTPNPPPIEAPVSTTAASAATTSATPAAANSTPATPPVSAPATAMPSTPRQTAAAQTSATPAATASSIKTKLPDIGTGSQLVATLDPHAASRAAIFERGGYGYIVFDRKFTLTLDMLTAGQPAPMVALEALDMPKASGYRFPLPPDVEMHANRDGTAWQIFLSKDHTDLPVSTALVPQPDFALGARFLLPLPDAPDPVRMTDPVVGDNLILVPLSQTEAFSVARHMADFDVLPAAQGLVIKPLNDKLVVHVVSDGLEISAEGGLHLSREADTGASQQSPQKARAAAAGKSMFDFAVWRGKPNETFTETRQRLQQIIVDVPDAERNRARLELARFYFANGNGEEALGLLRYLVSMVPDLTMHADFLALYGASKILAYQPADGIPDFDNPVLIGQPEIELWQAIAAAELRDWKTAEEKFSITESILAGYPEPFYSRFSVLAVESAIAAGKDREGKDWLDRLENNPHRVEIDPAIKYLHGVVHSKEGRVQAAEDLWNEVKSSDDRLYRIRAELALIDLGVATGTLTPAKAADKLESLRFGWRGDDLEFDILHRLGQFYIQAKNIKEGLNVLDHAVKLYPKSPMVPQIHTEMSGVFRDVFLNNDQSDLSAVDALTLYQQFRDLMPTGADGDAVMRNLAERLVSIDLLDQAASLLQELVKSHLQGVEKGRVGARLAAIRLLDHKPDLAITALDMSNDNSYPADLVAERLLLRAKALSEESKEDQAMDLLKSENSRDAKILRADVSMHAQNWSEAAKNLLDLIGPPPQAGDQLNQRQADWLVNCAIAYSLANDSDGLNKLAVDYGAAMAGTTQNDTFRVLTTQDKPMQLKDIAAVQSKLTDVDLFQGFLNTYRNTPDAGKKAAASATAEAPKAESTAKP
jgi:tetratricopeptide (TPR) repeat protein